MRLKINMKNLLLGVEDVIDKWKTYLDDLYNGEFLVP